MLTDYSSQKALLGLLATKTPIKAQIRRVGLTPFDLFLENKCISIRIIEIRFAHEGLFIKSFDIFWIV